MTRTERQADKRKQIEKERNDFDEYVTKLEEENERLKEENELLKKELEIDSIIINFAKDLVESNG